MYTDIVYESIFVLSILQVQVQVQVQYNDTTTKYYTFPCGRNNRSTSSSSSRCRVGGKGSSYRVSSRVHWITHVHGEVGRMAVGEGHGQVQPLGRICPLRYQAQERKNQEPSTDRSSPEASLPVTTKKYVFSLN